ncbi:MAG: Na+/H+ antiporter NhaA [Prevotellaceae bacterium]|nr:Na+/H+ antiporter NhaA [Prevotella sp.]MDD7257189.1 Na+/H+ antiporter NhaA [Prevotellaceae bacterium]MDY6130375.1 Na+/H+ antiporter NhaA [Prevotella sp.]
MVKYKNKIQKQILIPMVQFMNQEKAGGIVLGISVIIALIIANSPVRHEYAEILHYHLGFIFNEKEFLNFSLAHWINDGLMSMFFFVVGLELKREFVGGELRDMRKVVLPVAAAAFGMLLPAAIYLLFNSGMPETNGWGIPMATDIAFALAVVHLLGDRVPVSIKVFLTTLAIADDLGAVLVIALFYTSEVSAANLSIGFAFLAVMLAGNKMGVKSILFYGILGIGGVWLAFLMSGIHATIAAVLSAMVIPADALISENSFVARLRKLTHRFNDAESNDVRTLELEQVNIISRVKTDANNAIPPLQRLEHGLHPFVSFFVMPVFALGNAGVSFVDMDFSSLFNNNIAMGVMLGLLLGKPVGVVASVWLMAKLGLGRRSCSMTWRRLAGLGFLASIGFTMSMFITTLAFSNPGYHIQAKVGIFAASLLGGILGYLLLNKK